MEVNSADVNLAELSLVELQSSELQGSAGPAAIRANIVNPSSTWHFYRRALAFALAAVFLIALSACNRKGHRVLEVNYVSAVQATLRDQLSTIYTRVGTVKNGDRVEVLEHEKRFSRVRTAAGVEGWIEQRNLVNQDVYDGLQKLTREN